MICTIPLQRHLVKPMTCAILLESCYLVKPITCAIPLQSCYLVKPMTCAIPLESCYLGKPMICGIPLESCYLGKPMICGIPSHYHLVQQRGKCLYLQNTFKLCQRKFFSLYLKKAGLAIRRRLYFKTSNLLCIGLII